MSDQRSTENTASKGRYIPVFVVLQDPVSVKGGGIVHLLDIRARFGGLRKQDHHPSIEEKKNRIRKKIPLRSRRKATEQ